MNTNEWCVGFVCFYELLLIQGSGLYELKNNVVSTYVKHKYAVIIYFVVYYLFW